MDVEKYLDHLYENRCSDETCPVQIDKTPVSQRDDLSKPSATTFRGLKNLFSPNRWFKRNV